MRTRRPPGRAGEDGTGAGPAPYRRSVLILSASMGAGHDGAAREIARRIEARGHAVEVRDFLDAGPFRIGAALRSGYEFELRHVPSAYDVTYRVWHRVPWLCPLVAWLVCALSRRRVMRWVRDLDAGVVVSTYPLATLSLGRLRRTGRLAVPAVNFITDFGVHPLWVHRGIDLNLAVHEAPAAVAARRSGRPTLACGPAVSDDFAEARRARRDREHRAALRASFGLSPADRAVLVVAGSWGVGDVASTLRAVAGGGRFVPVVVCGRDEVLERRVRALAADGGWRAVVLGWTDRMPDLMVAADALVENAGGLTSFEAMRAGLPVVSFNPIAGHGRDNTAAMAAAGVSRLAAGPTDLADALDDLVGTGADRDLQVAAAHAMFRDDGAEIALGAPAALPARQSRSPLRLTARVGMALTGVCALAWTGLTAGVGAAAAAGAGVTHPPPGAGAVAYVGVRVDGAEVSDPAVVRAVASLHASMIVDQTTAEMEPAAVRSVAEGGIDVADGGQGFRYDANGQLDHPAPWSRAQADVAASGALGQIIGRPVTVFAPGRRLTAFDLYECAGSRLAAVVPNTVFTAGDPGQAPITATSLKPGQIYLLNGIGAQPQALSSEIGVFSAALAADGLSAEPLAGLR